MTDVDPTTEWGSPIEVVYRPSDVDHLDYARHIGDPGEYPFVRGPYPSMYRGRLWTTRQYAGFGTPEETNRRFQYLLQSGQTGLSLAFDLPTQIGYDSDAPIAKPEVGVVGVAIDTLEDMERVFAGISLSDVSVNFTINATTPIIMAMFAAVAERQGVALADLRGTVQNEPLKDFIARGTYIFPVAESMRLTTDVIEWCAEFAPHFNPISISSVHIQEAGANIVEELGITLLNAIAYVEHALQRGLSIDDFAPKFSFNTTGKMQFFQEICKMRAARRLWAELITDRYSPEDPRSAQFRAFGGICGGVMRPEEPMNNIVRMSIGAVQSALAGLQAVHLTPWDEPFAIPTQASQKLALRAQQIVAYETDIAATADPLAGSFFVEALTDEIVRETKAFMSEIETEYGGIIPALENGTIQRIVAESAYSDYRAFSDGSRQIVGANFLVDEEEVPNEPPLQQRDSALLETQIASLEQIKANRDSDDVEAALRAVREACQSGENVMPSTLGAVKAYATVQEVADAMRGVFGEYQEGATIV